MNMVASGAWLTAQRVRAIATISGLAGLAMLLFLWFGGHGAIDPFGQPVGSDFTAFWSAGHIANAGHAPSAYDPATLNADVRAAVGVDYPIAWIYPPTFLLLVGPLATLPYLAALFVWQAFSLTAITAVLWAILRDRRAVFVALASPLTPMVLAGGQNAFISASLLGAGLLALGVKPVRAGAAFGALTYKPQLGLVIAPLLLIERRWRAIGAAITMALVLIALSALIWGFEAWTAFATGLANGRLWMEQGGSTFYKSASLFSLARLWSAAIPIAYAVQLAGLLVGLLIVWRAIRIAPDMRSASVCAAAALSTPYLMDYDMATIGLGAAFFYAEGRQHGFRNYELSALAFIWAAPWFTRAAGQHLLLPLGPVATLLLAALILRRTRLTASPSHR